MDIGIPCDNVTGYDEATLEAAHLTRYVANNSHHISYCTPKVSMSYTGIGQSKLIVKNNSVPQ